MSEIIYEISLGDGSTCWELLSAIQSAKEDALDLGIDTIRCRVVYGDPILAMYACARFADGGLAIEGIDAQRHMGEPNPFYLIRAYLPIEMESE